MCLIFIFIPVFLIWCYLTKSDYFKIQDSKYFDGQNIFKVNLMKEAKELSKLNPDYQRVVLRRELPNRIIIDFTPRKAVAGIKLSKYFNLDKNGVLFYPEDEKDDNSQLPLIIGLKSKISQPRPGVKCRDNSLIKALEFVDNLNNDQELKNRIKIKEINLANVNDIFLVTKTGCKINLGSTKSLDKDLLILKRVISEVNSDLTNIEYINLRFKEPVIKYK